jgi:hypothetical protein
LDLVVYHRPSRVRGDLQPRCDRDRDQYRVLRFHLAHTSFRRSCRGLHLELARLCWGSHLKAFYFRQLFAVFYLKGLVVEHWGRVSADLETDFAPSRRCRPRLCGHPQEPRLNFGVNYWSGIILTEAPSIVETTDTQQRMVRLPPERIAGGRRLDTISGRTCSRLRRPDRRHR